jgi:hypothetical protein
MREPVRQHEEWQDEIPAYVAGRLDADMTRGFEAHLAACAECRATVAAGRAIAGALAEDADTLLGPHPEAEVLLAHARGAAVPPAVGRHLEVCAACALEAEVWRRGGPATRHGGGAPPAREGALAAAARAARGAALRAAGLALAAGLVIGAGFAWLAAGRAPLPGAPSGEPAPSAPAGTGPGEEAAPPGAGGLPGPAGAWSGPVRLHVLPAPLRSGSDPPALALDRDAPIVILAVPFTVPERAAPADAYRFEIRAAPGAVVWSAEMTAAAIRAETARSDVVSLAVTVALLPAGGYELAVRPARDPALPVLLQIPFRIAP